jgi:mannose-6-phosphate isomerase-like protein (cupin superfamily)
MIKRPQELTVNRVNKLRDGRGTTTMYHLIEGNELKGKAKLISRLVLDPGASIGLHEHINDFEVYYILKGEGRVLDDGFMQPIGSGDVVYTADGQSHYLENTGDGELELLAIVIND